jgi:Trk K+ transport system NAD-binding subunit
MSSSLLIRIQSLREYLRSIVWRGLILIIILACGLGAMFMGVGFSERPGVSDAGLLTKIYYMLGLFVLGGLDLGTPDGGPELASGMMWFTYFAAPALTMASLVEGVLRAVAPTRWRLRRLRGHIIVAGCGRMGRLYLKRLRESRPHKPVIMVDLRPDHPSAPEIRDVYRAQFLAGDIRDEVLLDALRLEHAERVFLFAGDDFVNLDAAAKILAKAPALAKRMVVHVANLHFLRMIADTRVARECKIVNKYHIAASQLVRTVLLEHFRQTEPRDIVVLAGFGRFGQTVLDELQRAARDKFDRVVVIDTRAEEGAAVFAQQIGFADFFELQIVEGDLRDPRVWGRVEGIRESEPVFIIGSGDDGTNLSTALWVKSAFPNANVMVRNFYLSSFAEEVSREGNIATFGVADLVANSMPDEWFGRHWLRSRRKQRRRPQGGAWRA